MQKISTVQVRGKRILKKQLTIGLDLGDRCSSYCVLNEAGEIVLEEKVPTTPEAMKKKPSARCRDVASRWRPERILRG
jgi:transposase